MYGSIGLLGFAAAGVIFYYYNTETVPFTNRERLNPVPLGVEKWLYHAETQEGALPPNHEVSKTKKRFNSNY